MYKSKFIIVILLFVMTLDLPWVVECSESISIEPVEPDVHQLVGT